MAREINPFDSAPPPADEAAAEQARQEAARQAGTADLSGLGDLAEGAFTGADLLASAGDVGGEVVGGALEAAAGAGELLGGCSGCSAVILIVLAAAGAALAAW